MLRLSTAIARTPHTVLLLVALLPLCAAAQSQNPSSSADLQALQRAAAAEAEEGKADEAIRDTQRALALQPDWKEGWWNLGTLQYEANQYANAAQSFQRVLAYVPNLGPAWALLGLCQFELKQYPAALAHLEKAQALGFGEDPETTRVAEYHLALLHIRNGDFDGGAALLHSAFGSSSPSSQIELALGLALLRVPLLPDELDPSKDALVRAAGALAANSSAALQQFPEFLKKYPDAPLAHYAYGLRLKQAGQWSEALSAQRKEVHLSPQSPLPWMEIRDLEAKLGHTAEAVSAAQKAKALASGDVASGRDPHVIAFYQVPDVSSQETSSAAIREKAMQDYAVAHYADAIAELRSWLAANPSDGTSWAVLGLSEFALKDYDNAQIHLQRGEQLGLSASADAVRRAKYTFGVLLIRAGDFDHALKVLSSAAGAGALQDEVQTASGLALLRVRKLPEEIAPSRRAWFSQAGDIAQLLFASRYDEAIPKFEAMLKEEPQFPFLHYAYGTALLAISKYKEAETQMRAEISISPNSELPYVRLASIALRQQQPDAARAPAEEAIRLNPDSAEAHYLLGRAALQLGDSERSMHELEIACRLAPTSPEAHFNLAKAYAKAGQSKKAEIERARFTELSAADSLSKQKSSQVYQGPHDATELHDSP